MHTISRDQIHIVLNATDPRAHKVNAVVLNSTDASGIAALRIRATYNRKSPRDSTAYHIALIPAHGIEELRNSVRKLCPVFGNSYAHIKPAFYQGLLDRLPQDQSPLYAYLFHAGPYPVGMKVAALASLEVLKDQGQIDDLPHAIAARIIETATQKFLVLTPGAQRDILRTALAVPLVAEGDDAIAAGSAQPSRPLIFENNGGLRRVL